MSISSFLKVISSGYFKHYSKNRIFLNQHYSENKNERDKYDLVIPRNAKGNLGLVCCIHGGGWVEGTKDKYTPFLFQYSNDKNVAAACINYRYVSKTVSFEDVLDDITTALSKIKAQGAKYGVNFDKVFFTGISAGGHLSLLYAYSKKDVAPIKPVCVVEFCGPTDFENPFFYSVENRVGASVGVEYFRNIISNGIKYDIDLDNLQSASEAMKKYSPINFVDENTLPTVIGHGDIDNIVPYQNSVDLDKKLTEFNIKHTFITFKNSNHECEDKDAMSEMMTLFYEYIDTYLK